MKNKQLVPWGQPLSMFEGDIIGEQKSMVESFIKMVLGSETTYSGPVKDLLVRGARLE